jgi:stress response protein YsnF
MAELDIDTALDWRGRTVVDRHGQKIGPLQEIYLDEDERPHWGGVHTALFGLRQTLVPLDHGALDGDRLQLPFDAEQVKGAPNIDPDVQLSEDQQDRLYRHYHLTAPPPADKDANTADDSGSALIPADDDRGRDAAIAAGPAGAARADCPDDQDESGAPGPAVTREAEDRDAMTRSEEEVHIDTRMRPRERVRIKKYVVTDHVKKTVPVRREEVRLEREPPEPPPDEPATARDAPTDRNLRGN